ncbi:related to histone transcription regulator HIP1 [Melanopsichium pennsylvanicum]|uniref:Protein HIR n=2 Tax=Melanopsichium pennsylvanicum TaxID=63383 RepID=A0AAJ5C7H7_9BASI|nr:related to histone transcription regulator HIP1 [Melanopsichium pennsylvanicum 4]SNX86549.1 related to histone transcription regulator HIP1 [Melanopsichium pennsylvanicum]
MSIILPDWVAHHNEDKKGKLHTIFSVAVHPDSSRLATAGLDTKIRIWSTASILNPTDEKDPNSHRLLSTLSRHTGSVLVVRWANSGRFLASGSDDTVALIWDLDPSGMGGGSFGSSEVNIESWRPYRRLAGHESDVVDLAWAGDDEFIATVGLDSKVFIWSGANFERLRTIDGHQGFVKGVVFDPLGQYLATASDDKTVKVWRTSDWSLEQSVTEPFLTSPSTAFFRRPSWSPDGSLLLCANAMSGPVFVASVSKRTNWGSDIYFVGHENAVVVTAFSPKIFVGFDGGTHSCVVALGSLDQSVSIWVTGLEAPVLVARDVFERQVMDLSWSADGYTLYACSSDGTVAVFHLNPELISDALSNERLEQSRAKHGVKRIRSPITNPNAASTIGTSDRPNVLQPRKAGLPQPARMSVAPVPVAGSVARIRPTASKTERLQQTITITKDGKRRIRPTLMGDDLGPPSLPTAHYAPEPVATSSTSMSSIQQRQLPAMREAVGGTTTDGFGAAPGVNGNHADMVNGTFNGAMAAAAAAAPMPATAAPPAATASLMPYVPIGLPFGIMPKGASPEDMMQFWTEFQQRFERGKKRKAEDVETDTEDIEPIGKLQKGKTRAEMGRTLGGETTRDTPGPKRIMREALTGASGIVENGVRTGVHLTVPETSSFYRRDEDGVSIEIRNFDESRPTEIARLDPSDKDRVLWIDFSPTAAILATATKFFSAAALEDSTILIYSARGRRIGNLLLDSACYRLESNGVVLMAVTVSGLMYRWNIRTDREIHRPVSVLNLLGDPENLFSMSVHANGAPIVMLRCEKAYTFDDKKLGWVCICDGWWAEHSEAWDGRMRSRGSEASIRDPVRAIEAEINTMYVRRVHGENQTGAQEESDDDESAPVEMSVPEDKKSDFDIAVTLRHLEARMLAATLLDSANEYKNHLMAYAKRIAEEGIKNQAEDLIKSLIGPIYYKPEKDRDVAWNPTIVGLDKRQLCGTVLQILARPRNLTSLVQPYQEILNNMKA